ncbi:MAG TPA: hypothetical protein VF504_01620 [Solirubrobacterales bacterium]
MRRRLSLSLASSIAALLLLAPAASAGSSEAGWGCTAVAGEPGWTLLATPWESYGYSPLVKEDPGVIVGWTVRVEKGLGRFAQQLSVFRPAGGDQYTKVAESAVEVFGETEELVQYPARIPVQKGDLLGLSGPSETLYCGIGPSGLYEGPIAVGETKSFATEGAVKPPVSAVVEEDLDRDGYGDSSQDRCPNSALFQTDCPLPALSVGRVSVKKRAILIEASNNTEASFEAVGEVRWRLPGGRKVRVGLDSGAARTVPGATLTQLRVRLPGSLRDRLDKLPPRRSLRARIDVKATNLVPYAGTQEIKVKLPGRKPSR